MEHRRTHRGHDIKFDTNFVVPGGFLESGLLLACSDFGAGMFSFLSI